MSLAALLRLAAIFLRPAVAGDPEDPPADPAPDPQDPPADPQADLDLDAPDPDPAPAVEPTDDAERRVREATERAERAEREATELRLRHQAPPASPADPDADLRKIIADPAADPQTKWKAEADLVLRQNNRVSQSALYQAEDVRDQTMFAQFATTQPALHKRYAAQVETELKNARMQGYNPKREYIFKQLIANDMLAGKFKKKSAAAPANPQAPQRRTPPGARADVSGRPGTMTRKEQLAKKLDGVQI